VFLRFLSPHEEDISFGDSSIVNQIQRKVVDVPNINRTRDLSPTYVNSDLPSIDGNMKKNSGKGNNLFHS